MRALRLLPLLVFAVATASAGASRPPAPYVVEPAAYREHPRFVVTYVGAGTYETRYHARPPNPGGARDTNAAPGVPDGTVARIA